MMKKGAWHFNMPNKVKEIVEQLRAKAEDKPCVNVEDVDKILQGEGWHNLPNVIDSTLELLGVDTKKSNRDLPRWFNIPSRVETLQDAVDSLDCRATDNTTADTIEPETVSHIKLVEFNADEDLSAETEQVDITVYFEDKSGDETPNVGKKLFLDKDMKKPLVDKKGAFYFVRPSNPSERETIKVRGTGTVKKTKFEV